MTVQDVAEYLVRGGSGELTKGCRPCRQFVRQLRKKPQLRVGWDDIPQELLSRFSSQLRQHLYY